MKNRNRRIYLIIGILFLLLVFGCTIYSRTIYQYSLPKVEIGVSRSGTFSFSREEHTRVDIGEDAPEGYQFGATITLSKDSLNTNNFYMYNGDKVGITFPAIRKSEEEGTVTSIRYEEDSIIMQVGFDTDYEISRDDNVIVYINKESAQMACIVPITALKEDAQGKNFVYLVREVNGPWSKEYVLKKEYVQVWASTTTEVSFEKYSNFELPVVINSEESLEEGMKVRFYP